MQLILKTNNTEQDKFLNALIKSLKALGISITSTQTTRDNKNKATPLKRLAEKGGIKHITNPVQWQNLQRKDRSF